MGTKLFKLTLGLILSFTTSIILAAVPHVFEPSTPAKAADVNENFDYLSERLDTIATQSIGSNLIDGEIEIEVDCTSNPVALSEAYVKYINYDEINFYISGSCYGDITAKRELDSQNQWTKASYQVMGQTIHISSKDGVRAKLIPNDLSGTVAMWGTFGNGLYLSGIDIEPASGDYIAVGFSRNGHGDVSDVQISNSSSYQTGIYVQEGAQVYIQNSSVSKADWSVYGRNNATIRVIGSLLIDGTNGIGLEGNSSFRNDGAITVSATDNAIRTDGSSWIGWGITTVNSGVVSFRSGSTVSSGAMTIADSSDVVVDSSTVNIDQLSANNLTLSKGNMMVSNSTLKGRTEVNDSGDLQSWQSNHSDVQVYGNSSFIGWYNTIQSMNMNWASYVNLYNSAVLEAVNANNTNLVVFDNSSFSGEIIYLGNTKTVMQGEQLPAIEKLSCSGMSIVQYGSAETTDLLIDVPNSGCFDLKAMSSLYELLKAQNNVSL